jgi:hypothetical protein
MTAKANLYVHIVERYEINGTYRATYVLRILLIILGFSNLSILGFLKKMRFSKKLGFLRNYIHL